MQSFSTTLFADADAEYSSADYVLFGVPFDGTTSFKAGCRDAPLAIRQVSYNIETYLPFYDLEMTDVSVHDMGDMYVECLPDLMVEQVADAVSDLMKDEKIPVMMGGEHSVTIGAVQTLKPKWYVVCDAHLDMQDEYRGSPFNHDCVTARVSEAVENIVIIGARSGCREEFEFARENYHLYTADDVEERGIRSVLDEVSELIGDDSLYLSIDADAIDCCMTPGLGTPEPFGLSPKDVRAVIRRLSKNAVGFDYVEVLPNDEGQTAMVAAHMIREFIAGHFCAKQE
ncbi:MAG TPA: agmatinase [Methanocorpusculum sp.]|jgi:agmatinase|nr:agmatinase [Methanocorpusculum sp.]MBR5142778.1 agmatinase [Methanocorpusculum sp.]MBR5449749.1 agmatinase [Methanocorpusculum sp.]HJJ64834.1 agmatinase [Methanocorpusculum sp.]HJJ79702.1 agmatinase [Methanocorpusculum sp.]